MSTSVNEFINLPIVSPAPIASQEPSTAPVPTDSVVVGAPAAYHDPARVTVWTDSITPANLDAADAGVAAFDIVFCVGISCEDGSCKTYKVVKRIGVDKCKIACEAECSSPVSVVESKNTDGANQTAKRFRILAGLE